MTTTTESCWQGCTIRGQHHTDCSDDTCRGCLPRPTDTGHLCRACYNRAEHALVELAVRIPWLETLGRSLAMIPAAAPADPDTTSRRDPAEGSVLHAAFLRADEIRGDLRGWVQVVLEDRDLRHGPGEGDPARWLLPHLPWLAGHEAITDLCDELARDMGQAMAWPAPIDVEPARHLDMPCPSCDMLALVYTPPRFEGHEYRVECTDPDCARVFSEDEFDWFRRIALGTAA